MANDECWNDAGIECPFCRHVNRNEDYMIDESGDEFICAKCERTFWAVQHVSISYESRTIESLARESLR